MTGFPKETREFLQGIAAHNEKAWFEANRPLYEAGYVEPAKAFVAEIGPRLKAISSDVQFDPKVNGSIGRINRDIRFSKDKRPYKEHLAMWFWHGDKKGWDRPGFYVHIGVDAVFLGTGMYGFDREMLENFRQSVIHPRSGKALLAAVAEVKARGDYSIGEKTRKLLPRGFETDPDRAEYLLYEGLTAGTELPATAAAKADFADRCLEHFTNTWPMARWLIAEVME
ncbi:MAG: hypothetical protein JWQ89_3219 [Devosia sp.]|uniref:DUF2461 domain-containing protein n=1 Tax=Devosia sp. TaxID=1871048 RepID=UPI0026355E81|nr:DUF2461 domain-containing protein [Devosia sp.]MDB5541492.1 hypothetical protein [Devosia sp.]